MHPDPDPAIVDGNLVHSNEVYPEDQNFFPVPPDQVRVTDM